MRLLARFLIVFSFAMLAIYCAVAFICWTWDASGWSTDGRFFYVLIGGLISGCIAFMSLIPDLP